MRDRTLAFWRHSQYARGVRYVAHLIIAIALTNFGCGSGPGINTSPLTTPITNTSTTTNPDGSVSSASIATGASTSTSKIPGRYGFDSVDCTVEQVNNGSPNLTQLNVIKSKQDQFQFLVALDATSTVSGAIIITDMVRGTTQHIVATVTSSGTFTSATTVNRQCGWEFVVGGAIVTCLYSEVPATCNWFLARG